MRDDLIRQLDAARILGVSRQYVNQLVREGKLPCYTVAKLVSQSEVERFRDPHSLGVKILDAVK